MSAPRLDLYKLVVHSIACFVGIHIATTTHAQTQLYVDSAITIGIGSQNGLSWATAYSDLNTAIQTAQGNTLIQKIHVAKGTYYPNRFPFQIQSNGTGIQKTSTSNLDKTFHLRPGLEMYGGYPNGGGTAAPSVYRTILDGSRTGTNPADTASNVVYMGGWFGLVDTAVISGFTIRNGKATLDGNINESGGYGGGIFCMGGIHVIKDCIIINNKSLNGGGAIYVDRATAFVLNDTITNNRSGGVGSYAANLTVHSCYLSNNNGSAINSWKGYNYIINNEMASSNGAGIAQTEMNSHITGNHIHHNKSGGIAINYSYDAYIEGNTIAGHKTTNAGAGIYLYGGKHQIINNLIMNDTSLYGGGIYNFNGFNTITGNTFIHNVAQAGGGIWLQGGGHRIDNNKVIENSAFDKGGGFFFNAVDSILVINNILAGNSSVLEAGGMYLNSVRNYLVAGNVFANNRSANTGGLRCNSWVDTMSKVVNNTFYNNSATDTITGLSYKCGALLPGPKHAFVYNNVFWKNKIGSRDTLYGTDYRGDGVHTFKNNALQLKATSYGTTNNNGFTVSSANNHFAADPVFTQSSNPAGLDNAWGTSDDGLQLHRNSPMVDTGDNALFPFGITMDVKGHSRMSGAKIDLGAYELSCIPANISTYSQVNTCRGDSTTLEVNSSAPYSAIQWFADSAGTTLIDTGYYYSTPALYTTDTLWVSTAGCPGSKTPVTVNVHGSSSAQTVAACDSFAWHNGIYTISGIYNDTLVDMWGCDSVLTLDLTITKLSTAITQNDFTLGVDTGASSYQWLTCDPYTAIPNATFPTYTPTANGGYAVVVFSNGCTDTSGCIYITGLGLEELNTSTRPLINPNPTTGIIVVEIPVGIKDGRLHVCNAIGQTIFKMPVSSGFLRIDLSRYPVGLYHIDIRGSNFNFGSKLLKQ